MSKILVVDDEQYIQEKIIRKKRKNGYEVDAANNGFEALDKLSEESYDLLLLDIFMPKKGGIETLIELKQKFKDKKIIIISGRAPDGFDAFNRLIEQFGIKFILHKPFSKKMLLDTVEKFCRNKYFLFLRICITV